MAHCAWHGEDMVNPMAKKAKSQIVLFIIASPLAFGLLGLIPYF
jgi:hypothetical protein